MSLLTPLSLRQFFDLMHTLSLQHRLLSAPRFPAHDDLYVITLLIGCRRHSVAILTMYVLSQ